MVQLGNNRSDTKVFKEFTNLRKRLKLLSIPKNDTKKIKIILVHINPKPVPCIVSEEDKIYIHTEKNGKLYLLHISFIRVKFDPCQVNVGSLRDEVNEISEQVNAF